MQYKSEDWKRSKGPIILLSCAAADSFADDVYKELSFLVKEYGPKFEIPFVERVPVKEIHFPNSDIKIRIANDDFSSLAGCDVYIFQDVEREQISVYDPKSNQLVDRITSNPANKEALKKLCEAVYGLGAREMTTITPSFPDARQHKRSPGEDLGLRGIIRDLESRFIDLSAGPILFQFLKRELEPKLENLIVASIDLNTSRAEKASKYLKRPLAKTNKCRNQETGRIESIELNLGDGINLEGMDILYVDDMVSTGGSVKKNAESVKRRYNLADIYIAASLPLLDPPAEEMFDRAYEDNLIKQFFTTDAVYIPKRIREKPWLRMVSIAPLFARAIFRLNTNLSLEAIKETNSYLKRPY